MISHYSALLPATEHLPVCDESLVYPQRILHSLSPSPSLQELREGPVHLEGLSQPFYSASSLQLTTFIHSVILCTWRNALSVLLSCSQAAEYVVLVPHGSREYSLSCSGFLTAFNTLLLGPQWRSCMKKDGQKLRLLGILISHVWPHAAITSLEMSRFFFFCSFMIGSLTSHQVCKGESSCGGAHISPRMISSSLEYLSLS